MGQKAEGKPTTTLRGKPVLTKYFQRQSSMATREVYLVKASHFFLLQFSSDTPQLPQWKRNKSLVGGFYWVIPSSGVWELQVQLVPILPTPLYCQQIFPTRLDTDTTHSMVVHLKNFTPDLHDSILLFLCTRLVLQSYTLMPCVWQSDSIWTVSKT